MLLPLSSNFCFVFCQFSFPALICSQIRVPHSIQRRRSKRKSVENGGFRKSLPVSNDGKRPRLQPCLLFSRRAAILLAKPSM